VRDLRGGAEVPEVFFTFLKMLAEFIACISFRHRRPVRAVAREAESTIRAQLISATAVTDAQRKRVAKALKRSSSAMSSWTARRMSR